MPAMAVARAASKRAHANAMRCTLESHVSMRSALRTAEAGAHAMMLPESVHATKAGTVMLANSNHARMTALEEANATEMMECASVPWDTQVYSAKRQRDALQQISTTTG
jgi:hypothetical protein